MSRRGENIYKRKDGRWEGRYIKGRKANGKVHYGYVYRRTYKETKEKLTEMKWLYKQVQVIQGLYSGSVKDWMVHCLDRQKNTVKHSTLATYKYKLTKYLLPYLGETELRAVTQGDMQEWIQKLSDTTLSSTTIHTIFQTVQRYFEQAVTEAVLELNPCKGVVLPKKEVKKSNL